MAFSEITRQMLYYALDLARQTNARAVLLYADVFQDTSALDAFLDEAVSVPVILVTRRHGGHPVPENGRGLRIQAPDVLLTRVGQIKIAVVLGMAQGVLKSGDLLICLSGIAGTGRLDTLVCMEVEREFEWLSGVRTESLLGAVKPEVFQRVLDIAVSLGNEGREGKPVGATFVLGDTEKVLEHVRQLILNPFRGYPEAERNVLDPKMEETVKEFATIDGAFVIRGDGVIESAGAYLAASVSDGTLPYGLGARHNSAAGITATTDAIAITVSTSTGNVTVFRGGKVIAEIERPRLPASMPARKLADLHDDGAGGE